MVYEAYKEKGSNQCVVYVEHDIYHNCVINVIEMSYPL